MQKIFDIHTHVYPEAIAKKAVVSLNNFYEFDKYYGFFPTGNGTAADLTESSRLGGVCGALLLGVATNAKQVGSVNDFLADLIRSSKNMGFTLVGFGGIHQDFPNIPEEVDRIKKLGLSGVKIHPDIQGVNIDDKRLMPLYEVCEGNMPIYFHIGDNRDEYRFSEAERLLKIKKRFPRLEVVAAHLGGYSSWEKIGMLTDLDGIWFDTSSALWAIDSIEGKRIIRALDSKRVMFGTDYPVAHAAEELERFMRLDLDEKECADILYGNAERFLRL